MAAETKETSETNTCELVYFGVPGRGEQTRLLFAIAGEKLKDTRVKGPEWKELKSSGKAPYGQLPFLVKPDGSVVAQSNAIANYFAATFKLLPGTPDGQAALEEFRGIMQDSFGPIRSTMGLKGDEKVAARVKFANETLPKYAAFLDAAVGRYVGDKNFVEGDRPTLADIVAYNMIGTYSSGWLDGVPPDCLAKYANLMKLRENMRQFPAIAEYLAREENQDDVRQIGWNAKAQYELQYFPARGRCEQLRLSLAAAGASWKNAPALNHQQFGELTKTGELPWDSLPILRFTQGGKTKIIAQTAAILQFIGQKTGLCLSGAEGTAEVLGWIGAVEDLRVQGYKSIPAWGGTPALATKFRDVTIPRWLGNFEKNFKGPYATGENATVADATLFDVLENVNGMIPGCVTEGKYVKLSKFLGQTFPSNEKIATYLKTERYGGSQALTKFAEPETGGKQS